MDDSLAQRYINYVVDHPWRLLLLSFIVIFMAASGGRFLEFTNDYREFFSEDNPELLAFEDIQNTYSKADNVMFVLAPQNGDVFTKETLAIVEDLTERAWQIPFSSRVDSISNYQHTVAEEDDLIVADLVSDAMSLEQTDLDNIRQVAINEPLLVHRLISTRGHVTAINVTVQLPGKALNEVGIVVAAARLLRDEILVQHPDLKIYLSGLSMMDNSFGEASQNDMKDLVPMMFLVVVIVLGILLRSFTATIATIVVISGAILIGMGSMGWLGWKITPPSASAPTIILTMAVADAVHLLVTFLHNLRHGLGKQAAMKDSLRVNLAPIFITSVTTAIGFLSMNFSDVPPFHDLGNVVAIGVMGAFVLSVTVLPALMMVLPVRILSRQVKRTTVHPMTKLADFVIINRRGLLWGMGALALVLISLLPMNKLDDQFVEYFDETVEFRRDTDFIVANMNGIYDIHYSLQQGESGGISEPAFLAKVELFANWLRSQDRVIHVNSITDTFKRLNKNMHGDDPAYYRLPESRELAAQYLLLYELSLPYGLDLNDQIDIDKSSTRLTVTFENLHTEEVLAIEKKIAAWLEQNMPEIDAVGASATIMFAHIGKRNVQSMLFGTTVALIFISFILMFALRSFRVGLISLAPNLIPAGMAFGIWGLMVGQVGLSLSVVTGMTLGIVVDDTVHFLSKYLRARREKGLDSQEAVRYAFNTVGVALWVTSLVLVAGFVVLGQSHFALNADMGVMTAVTIAIALIMDFLFLPPLLMKLEGNKHA
ncbi:MAG: MMPL family transporter [Piscirickettsiaceae bacterium]|nr:MMPL family transporter [Piscirickettsiaceae bacterium]